ncbi:hypothetical protein NAEGRDRAFT_72718 [Naegleria gruberi]|uniref:RING-type domain-containing protein n=1 Tax=Naegleria gruberi TaxID=5762 RepID=D2VUM6_NAEGR|nr:uncharacterized protein NAEGRDRAFT_72718 [Naegleria gruberi]EFC39536.1 hypothetical protein NAEGRDRAFT_72718 [Naegleria gruberi]|eukprot:XP_002672280.1 hypothetical protein NAEGRDRAFT_72718 [Naegleria gruberi strain NEG-M]
MSLVSGNTTKKQTSLPFSNTSTSSTNKPYLQNEKLWTAVAFQQEFTESLNNHGLLGKKKKFEQDPTKRKPTLSQKMGLKEPPPKKLTDSQWNNVERNLVTNRLSHLEDGCPICFESFAFNDIVCITNCGHVYHQNCLQSFERCNIWRKRSCPMCRLEDYQRKETKLHLSLLKNTCALMVQSLCRGNVMRKIYRRLYFAKYPDRHEKYCVSKLSSINERLESRVIQDEKNVDDFLKRIDEQVKQSLLILNMQEDQWNKVESKALGREEKDEECPICLCAFKGRKCTITSCGHIFHEKCLSSFEKFIESKNQKCPVCRQIYVKKPISFDE